LRNKGHTLRINFGYCYSVRSSRNRDSTLHSNNVYINWKRFIYALIQSMAVSSPILTEATEKAVVIFTHPLEYYIQILCTDF
jgi:hypothetical protein